MTPKERKKLNWRFLLTSIIMLIIAAIGLFLYAMIGLLVYGA